jgi:hypothetical protein
MTAPTTRATPKIALDQRAAFRHDTAFATDDCARRFEDDASTRYSTTFQLASGVGSVPKRIDTLVLR